MKNLYQLLIALFLLGIVSNVQSQTINIVRFNNTANYTAGSGVSVIINPTGIFQLNNQFILELSDAGGTFNSNPKILTTLNEFYVPVINGTLPATLATGSYKLRVRSTFPIILSTETLSFSVVAGGSIVIPSTTSTLQKSSNFFNCIECGNKQTIFGTLNRSVGATVGSPGNLGIGASQTVVSICNFDSSLIYNVNLIDVLTGTIVTNIPLNSGTFSLPSNLGIGTYVFEITNTSNSKSSIFSNVFLFHGNATNLGNSTSEEVCVNENVTFNIDISMVGIGRNYNGSKYTIDFGDGSPLITLTHAQLIANPIIVHTFLAVSCSETDSYFVVKEKLYNEGVNNSCSAYEQNGLGVEKKVNTSIAPIADFILAPKQCIDKNINAINQTTVGSYGKAGCLHVVLYTWSFKKPNSSIFTTIDNSSIYTGWINNVTHDLTIPSSFVTLPGCWTIKLVAQNPDLCQTESTKEKTIKIEAKLIPSFTNSPQSPICPNTKVQFTNTSNVVNLPCQEPTYLWTVSPSTGVQFVSPSTSASQDPLILFTQAGIYTVTLSATNSCGTEFFSKTIEVTGSPTVSFPSSSLSVCSSAPTSYTIDFSQPANSPVYSVAPYLPSSFAWIVSGAGVTSADYSFVGGTSATSQFPKITFTAIKTYTITVTVNGNCPGSSQATLTLTIALPPTITNQPLLSQTLCEGSVATALTVTATGGIGTFNYKWYSTTTQVTTGGTLVGTNSSSFIPPTTTVGTQYYYCNVSQQGVGCLINSISAAVIVVAAPQIIIQPQSSTLCIGGTIPALTVVYSNGPATASYQWYNGAGLIPGATLVSYNPPVATIGAVNYYCIITFSSGGCTNITSSTATITINKLPTINLQPLASQSVCVGGTIPALTVGYIDGSGTPTYQWYSNINNSTTGGTLVGTNLSSYTPPQFTTPGTMYYYVVISLNGNSCGSITSTLAEVITVADPIFSTQPLASQTICQGTTATNLKVVVTGGLGAFSYKWYSNTTATTTGGTLVGTNSDTYTPLTTTIGKLYYYCVVSQSGLGCESTSAISEVIIVPSPTITTQPQPSTICVGGTPTLLTVAYANGTGIASYQWYNSAGLIPGANGITYNPTNTVTASYYCIVTFSSGGCTNVTSNTVIVTVNPLPTIDVQTLATQSLCVGGTIPALTVSFKDGVGTATYQWYSNTTNSTSGGTAVGGNSSSYSPPVFTTTGTFYYYAVVSLSGSGCGTAISNVAQVIVVADPTVSTQPLAAQTLCQGSAPVNLSVVATGGLGAFSYKWYSNTTANTTGGTLVGTNSDTYTPLTNTVGILYYYCIISQPGLGCEVTSAIAKVTVVAAPSITTQPQSSIICVGGTPTSLTVTYTNGVGTPSYQWYSNIIDANTGGTAVSGATNVNFSPPNSPVGTTYYYCIITLPSSGGCSSISSNQAGVTINSLPTIDTQPLTTQSICVGGTIPALTVSYKDGVGTPTYQWYSNTSNSTSGGTAVGGNSASYTPPLFTTVGTFYYYAVVSLSGSGCGTAISNPAQVIVVGDPSVSTQPLADQTLCQGSAPANLAVVATGGLGTFSYQWYSNTNSTTIGGTTVGTNLDTYTPLTNTVGILYYYCVISQPGLGCQVTSAFAKVTIVAAPVINNQPQSSSICIGGAPSSLSLTYSNGTGTASYQWYDDNGAIAGATNINYTPIITATTNYYCIITFSSGGCTSITSSKATVTVYPLPTIDVQPLATQNICVGGTIPALTVSYKDGVGTPTYQWYSNTTNSTSGGTAVGGNSSSYTPPVFTTVGTFYYYVVVSLGGNGCGKVTSNPSEIIVVGDPIITSQPLPSQTLCQGSAPTALSVVASGGIGAYSYQWFSNTPPGTLISGATTDTFIPNTTIVGTTKYYCVISQPNLGCEVKSAFAEVIIVPSPIITTQPQSSSVCEGGTPTPLTVAYINGTGTTTYQWFSNTINSIVGGTPISGATAMTFNPPANLVGTVYYYCEVRFSSGGCTVISSDSAEVNVFQIPVIVNQKLVVCSGDVLNFIPQQGNGNTVPANTMYSWTLTSITPLGAVSGATNAVIPQSSFTQTLINSTNQVATALYTVTPKAAICSGNPFTIEVQVYPKPEVVFSSPNQIICNKTSSSIVTLTSSTPGAITFSWTASVPTGITGAILSGTNSIPTQNLVNTTNLPLTVNYSAIGTFNYNGAGCSGATSIYSITVNPTIVTSSIISNHNGYGVSYFGGLDGSIDLTVTGGSGNYTYIWSGPNGFSALTQDLNGVAAGTYTVSINDGYCAPVILTFILTQPPELLFQEDLAAHVNLICYGASNGSLGITITQESVSPYDFNVVGSNGTIVSTIMNSANLNQLFTGLPSDIYSVVITDGNGGVKTLNGIHITQPNEIVITAATTPIICYGGNDASITITESGGTAPYKGQWDNLALGFYQNNLSSGDYTITVTDANNCTKTLKVNIPDPPIFTIYPVVKNISCFGAHDGSINLNIVGGIAPVALVWSDNPMIGNVRNNLGPGTYTVTISDGKPCYITKSFTIVEPQPLVLAANTTHALDCNDANSGSINLMVSGGTPPFSYAWSNGANTEDLAAISAGNYLVTVTDSRGCTKTAQYIITRPSPIVANVQTDTEFNCETRYVKQTFVAQVSGGVPPYQLFWSSGTVSGANNQFMNTTQNGLVVLNAKDVLGCSTNYTFNVTNPTLGTSTFTTGSIGYSTYGIFSIIDPIQFTTTATGDFISIIWDFGDGSFSNEENPLHTYVKEGNYVVKQTVTYPFGCVYTHIITLIVTKGYELIMPTAFTPNMDGINDTIKPVYRGLKSVQIDIYDTWGELIYSEKGDVLKGWDGKIKDVESENGNYYCKVSGETFYGTTVYKNTPFVLIK